MGTIHRYASWYEGQELAGLDLFLGEKGHGEISNSEQVGRVFRGSL